MKGTKGGCIYFDNIFKSNSTIPKISSNKFFNNKAQIGGAIFYTDININKFNISISNSNIRKKIMLNILDHLLQQIELKLFLVILTRLDIKN